MISKSIRLLSVIAVTFTVFSCGKPDDSKREISITETSTSPPLSPAFWSKSPSIHNKLRSEFPYYDVFIVPSSVGFSVIICAPVRETIPKGIEDDVLKFIEIEIGRILNES